MKHLFLILSLLSVTMLFSQDQLFKRDNTKLEVKILEVNPTEIKYKLFSYQDGPLMIVNKNDVAMIIYQNGTHEVMSTLTQTIIVNQPIYSDRYQFNRQEREEKINDRKEKFKALTKNKNIVGLNTLELLNGGVGLSYLREFNPYISVYIPIYFGFSNPTASQSIYTNYSSNISNYKYNLKNVEVGLGINFQTSGERAVTHFIGPLVSVGQYTGIYNERDYNSGYNYSYITRGFVLNRTNLLINNGLIIRGNPNFNIMANIAVGFHTDHYIAGNENNSLTNYSYSTSVPINTFKAGLTFGYRF